MIFRMSETLVGAYYFQGKITVCKQHLTLCQHKYPTTQYSGDKGGQRPKQESETSKCFNLNVSKAQVTNGFASPKWQGSSQEVTRCVLSNASEKIHTSVYLNKRMLIDGHILRM